VENYGCNLQKNAAARHELHLRIEFVTDSKFKDEAGVDCAVQDTIERQWQHLNFFEHHCFLNCKVPRITISEGKVRTVDVPWARAINVCKASPGI